MNVSFKGSHELVLYFNMFDFHEQQSWVQPLVLRIIDIDIDNASVNILRILVRFHMLNMKYLYN